MANSNGWGDGAANNSIGWGQGAANNSIGWGSSHATSWAGATDIVGLTTDPAASAYFTATGITGATQQLAIDNLVKGLKADGLWSKMKAVYPFVTDNRNILDYTEDFSNAYWTKFQATVTSNSTTAPNGTTTADTVTPSTNNNFHFVEKATYSISTTSNNISASGYFKANGYNFISLIVTNNTSFTKFFEGVFNLSNGTIEPTGRAVNYTGTRSIESVGNGWYRCSINITNADINSTHGILMSVCNTNNSDITFAGNGTSGAFFWGAQFEMGALTTYQPIATTQQSFISSQFKFNLVNPVDSDAAFRLVFNGGWTHSSNGATPNGTNGYADTKLVPSSVLTLDSNHISYYSRTNANSGIDMGVQSDDVVGRTLYMAARNSVNNLVCSITSMDINRLSSSNTDSNGFYTASRSTNTSLKSYKNSVLQATNTTAGISSQANAVLAIGCLAYKPNALPVTFISYSTKQCAFSSIGDGLTDTEAANLYTRVQAFQTSLSRQV